MDSTFWRRLEVAKDSYTRLLELIDELTEELQSVDMECEAALDENVVLKARIEDLEQELKYAREPQ